MSLETINWILTIAFAVVVALFVWYLTINKRKAENIDSTKINSSETKQLQLQAYERLTIFTDRMKLDNLITRLYQPNFSAREMQQLLLQNIKQEFEYNISQQIYINNTVWQAIEKMKEQNVFIINQIADTLPQNATAMDLNKSIVQYSLNNPDATMNKLVLNAIQFEAKKFL